MTNASATPSPLPAHIKSHPHVSNNSSKKEAITPPKPKLRLHLQDARHTATPLFFRFIPDLQAVLDSGLAVIIEHLYTSPPSVAAAGKTPASFTPEIPATRSVTVILQDFSGVAYTNGTDLDNDHKEIHFSLSYINHVCNNNADPLSELKGVLTHELVHCYQHTSPPNSKDIPGPPGGLIEGIADFVRLKAGFVPPHWQRPTSAKDRPSKWDEGYQHTAFFLAWLEDERIGRGAVGLLNDRLLRLGYVGEDKEDTKQHESSFWKGLFGVEVSELWEEYGKYLDR
ncbi:hypothetical protein PISL3812_06756 [Talaromyces islandicus]|uniref:PBSP domain protein n=1 Tax=Talaromyces islandicus TaxID=28573 RepID=A0A0U1M2A5_TALIS|nr:hypothetical protein PISL3812_06756 [Talaromyces islandicus]